MLEYLGISLNVIFKYLSILKQSLMPGAIISLKMI